MKERLTFFLSLMEPFPRTIILQPVSASSCFAVKPRGPRILPTKLNCKTHTHTHTHTHTTDSTHKGTHTRTQKQPLQITHAHTSFVVCEYNDKGFSTLCFSTHTHKQSLRISLSHTYDERLLRTPHR